MPVERALSPLPGLLVAFALLLAFAGERVVGGDGVGRIALDGAAGVLLLAALGLRAGGLGARDPATRRLVLWLLFAKLAVVAALGLYAASVLTNLDGSGSASTKLVVAAFVVLLAGGFTLFSLELVAAPMRRARFVELHRVRAAAATALGTAFAIAGLFALNVAAEKSDLRRDLSFGAPTSPSGATLSMLEATKCEPEITLFFERGSTALPEVQDYFDALAHQGVPVKVMDQALDPALAKEMKVSRNGTVGLKCGERSETYFVGEDRDAAQRKIQKLDEEMRTRLAKLTRDASVVYFTTGHGERGFDEGNKGERPQASKLKKLAEAMNAKVKRLGIGEGLGSAVPQDAGAVVVHGPTSAFLPEEAATLKAYVEGGGSLLLLLDPGVDHGLSPVLQALGVVVPGKELVNDKEFVRQSYTDADKAFLFSTSFGSHKAVKTLSAARGKVALLFQGVGAVEKAAAAGEGAPKYAALARTRPNTFPDEDGDRAFDEGQEKRAVLEIAAAIELPKEGGEARAVVVGDSDVGSDLLVANEANAVFGYEALLWLLRDDAAGGGDVALDEDVPIRHTRDEDAVWFYGTTFAAPAAVLGLGLLYVRTKRRRRSR